MMRRFHPREILTPPQLPEADAARRAALLHWVLVAAVMIMAAVFAAAPFLGRDLRIVWPLHGFILAAIVVSFWLLRMGRVRVVSIAFPTSVWALATVAAALYGGLAAPAVWAYPVVVLLAGFFWGRGAAVGFAALSVLTGVALAVATSQGVLPNLESSPANFLSGMAGSIAVTAVLMHLGLKIEEQGRKAADQLRLALQSARVGTWEWDIRSDDVTWSDNVESIFRLPTGSFKGTYAAYLALIHPEDRAYLEGALRQTLEADTPYDVEHRILSPEGKARWLGGRGEVTRDGEGRPVRLAGTVMDITDRKKAELALEESERLLAEAQRVAQLGSWEWELATGRFTWTQELYRILGLNPAHLTPTYEEFLQRVHPDERSYTERTLNEARDTGQPIDFHFRIVRPDGSVRIVRTQAQLLKHARGEPARLVGTGHDVTEAKEIEDALRRQVWRNEKILDTLLDGYILADDRGRILEANPAACELTHYSRQELCELTIPELDAVLTPEEIHTHIQTLLTEGALRLETRMRRKDGALLDVELSITVMHEERGRVLAGFIHDTTKRKRAERALTVISECRQALLRATEEGQLLQNVCEALVTGGGYRLAWIGAAEPHGERRVRPVAQSGFEDGYLDTLDISLADPARGRGPAASALRTGRAAVCRRVLTDPALASWRADAIERGYQSSIALPLVHEGEAIGVLNIYASEPEAFDEAEERFLSELTADVAHGLGARRIRRERARAEEALRESEARYRALVTHSPISIWTCDTEGTCDFANQAALDLLGIADPDAVVGSYNAYRDTTDPTGSFTRHLERAYHGDVVRFHQTLDMHKVKYEASRTGTLLLDTTVFPLPTEAHARPRLVVMQQDITEHERAVKALRESEERYRTLFVNAPLGIGVADTNGNFLDFNEAILLAGGYAREDVEALGNVAHLYYDPEDRARMLTTLREHGRVTGEEVPFKAKDGSPYYVSLSLVPVSLEGRSCVLAMSQDIDERRRAQEALRQREEEYRTLFETMAQGVVYQDADGAIIRANPAAERILGLTLDQMQGRTSMDPRWRTIHEDGSPLPGDRHPAMVALRVGRAVENVVMGVFHPGDDDYRWINVNAIPQYTTGGTKPDRVYATFEDITERKLAQDRESGMARILEASLNEIYVFDAHDLHFIQVNRGAQQNLGYSMDELRSLTPLDLQPAFTLDSFGELLQPLRSGAAEKIQFTTVHRRKDGSLYDVDVHMQPAELEGSAVFVAIVLDVTERRQAERRLEESEERLRSVIENTPIILFAVDREGRFTLSEGRGLAALGLKPGQVVGQSVFDVYADIESIVENLRAGLTGEERSWTVEVGGIHWNTRVMPLTDAEGTAAGLIGVGMDITELVRAEETVRQTNEQQGLILSNIDELVYSVHFPGDDPLRGNIDFISGKVRPVIGYTPEQFLEQPELWLTILHPDDREPTAEQTIQLTKTRSPVTRVYRLLHKVSREYRWMEDRVTPRIDEDGNVIGIFGVARDITERREAEETLRQYSEQLRNLTARVEAVREEERTAISREIHDELGQALTGLKMDLSWLMGRLTKRAKVVRERGEAMMRLVDSTIEAVRDLSTRLRPALLDDLGLAAAVEWQAQDVARRTGIEVDVFVDEQVRLDRGRATAMFRILQETLTNVLRHAKATRVKVRLAQDDGQVMLTVSDNGVGISDEALDSTRSLGLLGIRERASVLGGSVTFERNPERGTTVSARVPLTGIEASRS